MSPDFQTQRSNRRLPALDAAFLGVALLTLGVSIERAATSTVRHQRMHASLQALRVQIGSEEARLRELQTRFKNADVKLATQTLLTQEAPPPLVLATLERILPAGARLDGITLDYGETLGLTFVVVARRPDIYDVFLERLESSPNFSDLAFGAESREGEVRISISATYRGGGK